MKVAILGESAADEAGLRILVDAVLACTTEPATTPVLRPGGWASVKNVLPGVIQGLHYYTTDAYGLVCVADANHSVPHSPVHEEPGSEAKDCRLCTLRGEVMATLGELRDVPGRPRLKVAIGLACPAIEAWYLCGGPHQVKEMDWEKAMGAKQRPSAARHKF